LESKRKAFFPISLSNERFASKSVLSAIAAVLPDYDDITILVADKLQIYNQVSRAILEGSHSNNNSDFSFFQIEDKVSQTLVERERWLKTIKAEAGPSSSETTWHIHGLAAFGDQKAFDILRRISILYHIDLEFRSDVDQWAHSYVQRRYVGVNQAILTKLHSLSASYIIEEAALSIRIRVFGRLTDEFYIGDTTEPIAKLYWGRYSKTIWELAGLAASECRFSFHEYFLGAGGKAQWKNLADTL
jgi:hypothetical protein